MATEFICTINKTGADYDWVDDWVAAVQSDFTSAQTRVYAVSSVSGTVADGATVTGSINGYTATVRHVNVSGTSPRQVLVYHDTASETFANNEVLSDGGDPENTITLTSTAGDTDDTTIAVLEFYDDNGHYDDYNCTVTGSTTSATNYIKLTAPVGERHNFDDTGATLDYTGGLFGRDLLRIEDAHVTIEWLNFTNTGNATSALFCTSDYLTIQYNYIHDIASTAIECGASWTYVGVYRVHHNLIHNCSSGMWIGGWEHRGHLIYNNIIYDCTGNGIYLNHADPNYNYGYCANNTVYSCDNVGITDYYNAYHVINNISYDNATFDFDYTVNVVNPANNGETGYNFSKDDTADDVGIGNINGDTDGKVPDFVSGTLPPGIDLHLDVDSDAIGAGTDLSSLFTVDFDGATRYTWDIGADEHVYRIYTSGNYASLPTDDADLETSYSYSDEDDVTTDNGVRVAQTADGEYAIHQFKNEVGTASSITFNCNLQSDLSTVTQPMVLQIYNYNSTTWETLDTENTVGANTDFTLTGNIPDMTNYVSSGWCTCRVYQLGVA